MHSKPDFREILRRHRALAACILAIAVMVGFKLLGILVYDTNDDTIMAGLTYGYFGSPQGLLVYIHPVLGQTLALMQKLVPAIPWYYLFELGLLTCTLAAYCYLILDREGGWKLPSLTVLILFYVYAVLFRLQYTKIAGGAAAAGCLMLFHGFRKGKWMPGVLGVLLAALGYCLRSDAFFMVLIPLFGVGVVLLWELLRENKKAALGLIGAFAALFAICGGLMLAEKSSYASEEWLHYRRYNDLRTELLDYGFPDYGENQALYESLSISEEDLALFQSWDFGDPEIFNEATMEALCQAKGKRSLSLGGILRSGKEAVRGLASYDFSGLLLCAGLLVLCVGDKKGLLQSGYALAARLATEMILLCLGRGLRERVDVPMMLAALAIMTTVGVEKGIVDNLKPRVAVLISGSVLLSQIPGLIARKDDAMERYVGAAHLHSAYQVLATDKSRLYLTRTDELPPDRMPGKQGAFGYLENISPLGGWLTESPYALSRYAQYDVENPFRDLVDREDVRLLSNDVEPVLGYIRRHYDPDARAVAVRSVNGEYTLYRIVSGEVSVPELPEGNVESVQWTLEPGSGTLSGTMVAYGENSFAADIYVILTDREGNTQTLLPLQTPQAGIALREGRYGAFSLEVAPGSYRVTLTLAGEANYTVDAGQIEIV